MSRSDLQSKTPGFPVYGDKQLPKVNAMRADKTQPSFYGVPILSDGQVMLSTEEALGGKPASCSTCSFHNEQNETCILMGPEVMVATVTGTSEHKEAIEYWPCCSEHNYGEANSGPAQYIEPFKSPDALGLIWINAPERDQQFGGANCGGVNGGDDCDHYQVEAGEKWDNPSGFCRVLQHEVQAGEVCAAWQDDDQLSWQDAQQLLRGASEDRGKKKMAKEILGRD